MELVGIRNEQLMFLGQIALILALPLIISVYNTIRSADPGEIFIKNLFLGFSNTIGLLFSNGLSDSFIEPDPKADPVIALFISVIIVYTVLLTLICCGIKALLNKK